ncbi:MAG: AAA family ATPase, partial [Bifidobacteriaceae bacterium]|nr:AAA family ATPase [Bifidobacteriaceae bacterium]
MSRRVMPIDVQEFEVMVERKMPLGIQTFSEITKSEYVYVDKTGIMHKLANSAKFIFLSRPRRFGKSLMLTTLKAYFQGKKELFKGLEAYDLENAKGDKAWQEHVVFHFDFNAGNYKSNGIQELHTHIRSTLGSIEKKWGILVNPADTYSGRFQNAIKVAAEKSGKKVVILIDEYDKPLLQRVESGLDESTTLRDELRGFYGVLKSSDQYIRFAMLTGVTKFSKLSVFSDLNQLYDISLDTPYATICGITQEELEANFAPEIQKLADNNELTYDETLHKLRDEYDGYDFTGKGIKVYNPFSTVNVLNISEFRDYWFQSGTPTFLIDEMQRVKFDILNFENGIQRTEQAIADYKSGENDAVPLLFQAGYLTIKSMNKRGTEFILGYPNKEVERGFLYSLSSYFFKNSTPDIVNSNRLIDDLYDGNL